MITKKKQIDSVLVKKIRENIENDILPESVYYAVINHAWELWSYDLYQIFWIVNRHLQGDYSLPE